PGAAKISSEAPDPAYNPQAMDWSPVWISLATSVTATLIVMVVGLAAAAWRERHNGPAMALVDGLFLLPLVLPPTVVGFFLLLLFGRNGPLGKLLLRFGQTVVFSWPATVIAAAVVSFPLMYLTARAALEQVDPHFLQAARTLGASEWRVFREVALPLAWPGILAGTILSFARALGEFGATLMLAGNIPGKTATIPIAIYFAVEADDVQHALAWCAVDMAISLSLLAALYYWTHARGPARWVRR
ncbi:MAG TPA: molybdate ABC transporter permease subunit, partial [Candidatus Acidoferrales bacterium]|nr:molybdate ABC transporter permease subunit [Candidatus Acidoferrales bacterium]